MHPLRCCRSREIPLRCSNDVIVSAGCGGLEGWGRERCYGGRFLALLFRLSPIGLPVPGLDSILAKGQRAVEL